MIWKDPDTGKEHYYGDSGDFICVSNFTSATLDLPIKSSASANALTWEANPKKVPPLGTKVYLYLTPELPKEKGNNKKDGDSSKDKEMKKKKDDKVSGHREKGEGGF